MESMYTHADVAVAMDMMAETVEVAKADIAVTRVTAVAAVINKRTS